MVMHACNPCAPEVETRGSEVQGQLWLPEICFKVKNEFDSNPKVK